MTVILVHTDSLLPPTEHTEGTSTAYRKPEWVTRMEELKEAMSGIVERSRARRSGSRLQQSTSSKTSELPVLHDSQAVLQSLPCVSSQSTPSLPPSSPSVSQMSVTEEQKLSQDSVPSAVIVSVVPRMSVDADPASYVSCASVGSIASTSVTSISVDSLERPPISHDPSCMSSRDTISECGTEYGSQTETECQSDSQTIGSQGDRLAHLEVASSLSIGDLSMGSDSVFISETETVSDATSRRPSAYTINPIHFTEDQETLNISKTSLMSPNTKHVHFKFDADTSSSVSEDDRPTESPNFAQVVLTNYLSSHRNSISQVIEALSSLAQADITAEIEMTIEQNKKMKVNGQAFGTPGNPAAEVDPNNMSAIEISKPLQDTASALVQLKEAEIALLAKKEEKGDRCTGSEISDEQGIPMTLSETTLHDDNEDLNEFEKLEKITEMELSHRKETELPLLHIQEKEETDIKDIMKTDEHKITPPKESDVKQCSSSTCTQRTQRKSILKNKQTPEVQPSPEVKVTRQLTPTLRRRPILKKKESMVTSSQSDKTCCTKETVLKKLSTGATEKKKMDKVVTNAENSESKLAIKSKPKCEQLGSISNIDCARKAKNEKEFSLSQDKGIVKSDNKSDTSSFLQMQNKISKVKSASAPTTPLSPRKQRPSPPIKLPLVMSREPSAESLRDSKIPRFGRSNESTPSSTPQSIRKFSPRSDEGLSKIPKPMSREQSFDSLTGCLGNAKRNVWSEPSSPMSTPQLIRKTFKQFHENTKIPMPVYQYSSTEDLEDSSPQESPRPSREKRQRCLVRTSRAASADRALDVSFRSMKDENGKSSKISWRTQSPLPVSPRSQTSRVQSPTQGRVNSPIHSRVESPVLGRVQSPTPGGIQSPTHGRVQSPSLGRRNSPTSGRSSQSSSRLTSPGASPKKTASPSSTPKLLKSPSVTPKRVQSPIPLSSFSGCSGNEICTGARPKVQAASHLTNRVSKKRSQSHKEHISASDSEQNSSTTGKARIKSSKASKNGEMRKADSLEEFLLLENECTD